ncbi:MAG: GIY-YIG nuclease family protein [Chlorobi bacterium]|nr:GIY-YIG nuclease family protein [Chlorobiota bacterium]
MAFYVYILYSQSIDTFYRGQTNNIENRLKRHNKGLEKATVKGIPWLLLWYSSKETRKEALVLEKKLKNLNRKRLIRFIKKYKENIAGPDALIFINQWSGC